MEYHEAIQKRLEELGEEVEAVKDMQTPFNVIESMSNNIGLKYTQVWPCNDNAAFDININDMDEIKVIIKYLGNRRYFIKSTYDDPKRSYRSWIFKHKESIHTIQMFAYFFKENQSCKFVKTGIKEVDIMELKCS